MSYSLLSRFYDQLVRFDYQGYFNFVADKLPKGKGLDLCCGSGVLTKLLAESGREMTGVDISPNMLQKATERAKRSYQKTMFLLGDVNELKIQKKYNFVISSCDGLNYVVSEKNLKKIFIEVYNCLATGGVFVFDVSTPKKAEYLADNVFFEDSDEFTFLWTNKRRGNAIDMEFTSFTLKGDLYEREDDASTQYFYENQWIMELLKEVGFSAEAYDGEDYQTLKDKSQRLLIVAKK